MKASFLENKDAVSSVVTAILLLSVITTFLAAINSYYIPSLVADHEIHHMQDVRNSFMEIAASASPGSSKERVLIPLGDGGMPFISSLSSSGTLTVSPDKGKIEVTMTNSQPVEYQELQFNKTTTIQDIQSLSHLMLKITDSAKGTYIAEIGSDKVEINVDSSGATVTTTIDGSITNYTILGSESLGSESNDFFCFDLLDPAYGFNEVVSKQSPEFNLRLSGMNNANRFDVGYTILLSNDPNSRSFSSDGQLSYKASNNQWIDQDYIFENGAVILNQGSNSTIKSQPFFNIDEKGIELCLFNITSEDASVGGNGAAVVNVFGTEGKEYEYRDVGTTTIKIASNYTEAWEDYFKRKGVIPTKDPNKWVKATFSNRNVSITTSDVDIVLPK
ncbi:hypothetical protein [uncultured Methanomethylovorans sp.]|uniref:DUF7289 family protein n=1 Tax=uncultured Methanomethylovorans sp. TaxID=183759 RepID=UPI002AA72126|nr:hypothetical protein [uncultured Methanomethylovorans sp.]